MERGLTLQTCWPIMTGGNVTHRLIVHGGLDGWAPKTDGMPAEYTETTDTTIDKIGRRIVTVSEKKNLPVTGVLGICAFIIWILLDTIGWMCSHRRMTCYWHGRDIGGPITWLWRLNAGIMPSNTVIYRNFKQLLEDNDAYQAMAHASNPYGDGRARHSPPYISSPHDKPEWKGVPWETSNESWNECADCWR